MKTRPAFFSILIGFMIQSAYANPPVAGSYYSSGSSADNNGGYYSSTGNAPSYPSQPAPVAAQPVPSYPSPQPAPRHHSHKDRDKFSISVQLGNPIPPPPPPTYVVAEVAPRYPHRRHLEWLDMSEGDPLPMNAVIGGYQPRPRATLYVCRAFYQNGMHPGKLFNGRCNIGWGGSEIVMSDYQVLVARGSLNWVPARQGYVPTNAVQGGDNGDGTPLYVCQINYRGGTHPGKIVGRNCNIGWGGREVVSPFYNVLVR